GFPVAQTLEGFLVVIELDVAATLAGTLGTQAPPSRKDLDLARRCSRLAVMAMIVSKQMGYSVEDCQLVGTVGLLHDIALFDETAAAVAATYGRSRLHYRDHPLQSASLLSNLLGVSEQ